MNWKKWRSRIGRTLGCITLTALFNLGVHGEDNVHVPYEVGVNQPPQPVIQGKTSRPMRYQPENGAFVIENGDGRFSRPLYLSQEGARLDAGDRPAFALSISGGPEVLHKGGVLKFGALDDEKGFWFSEAAHVRASYFNGRMAYDIADPRMEKLHIEASPLVGREGAIVQVRNTGKTDQDLLWAYGGATGKPFAPPLRGDLGYYDIVNLFSFHVKHCAETKYEKTDEGFLWQGGGRKIRGLLSDRTGMRIGDGQFWDDPAALLDSEGTSHPVAAGRVTIKAGDTFYLCLVPSEEGFSGLGLADLFEASVQQQDDRANQLKAKTPDPYINAMMPALSVAAEALFDGEWYTHGNVAWRRALFGWRPAYTGDATGLHERTRSHLRNSFSYQMISDSREDLPVTFFSDGYLNRNYTRLYNMNVTLMDVLMRHLRWTGDKAFAREAWPYLERHLAWMKRLFDRDGLYDAKPTIWPSDALQYNGGGAAHTSAFSYFHNKMAAEIAAMIGEDGTPYAAEAERIRKAMEKRLWLKETGCYAEYRDVMGLKLAHPEAAIWSIYHSVDSEVADPFKNWMMASRVRSHFPHIPVHGEGVPVGDFSLIPESIWMPYTWSINNVAVAEIVHACLASWQAGDRDLALKMFMGTILESMYRGTCPGNIGMTLAFDPYRGECIRDFGFIGIVSRAVVEGFFGVRPDLVNGKVRVWPGWPTEWKYAFFEHPEVTVDFKREGQVDRYSLQTRFDDPVRMELVIPARAGGAQARVNGSPVEVTLWQESLGKTPYLLVETSAMKNADIEILWDSTTLPMPLVPEFTPAGEAFEISLNQGEIINALDPQECLARMNHDGTRFTATPRDDGDGDYTIFLQLRQGNWEWWAPVDLTVSPPLEIDNGYDGREVPRQKDGKVRFHIRNNTPRSLDTTAEVQVEGESFQAPLKLAPGERSSEITLEPKVAFPGHTEIVVKSGKYIAEGTAVNWGVRRGSDGFEMVDLSGVFNDRINEIFASGKYTEPVPPAVTLRAPENGFGQWCHPNGFDYLQKAGGINGDGMMDAAAEKGGVLTMECGVPFQLAGKAGKNVVFVTRWDALPSEVEFPLSGKAHHVYLLMAGSTHHMQSRFENGEVEVTYADGLKETLTLRNPETWWPIERDYFIDDYAFRFHAARPPRFRLDSGEFYYGEGKYGPNDSRFVSSHHVVHGAGTVLDIPLNPERSLKTMKLKAIANEVIVGLLAVTLAREALPPVEAAEPLATPQVGKEIVLNTKDQGADTFLAEQHSDKNWDGGYLDMRSDLRPGLPVEAHNVPVLRFNLPELEEGVVIEKASLKFEVTRPSNVSGVFEVYGLVDGVEGEGDWDPASVTYDSMPGISSGDGKVDMDFSAGQVVALGEIPYDANRVDETGLPSNPQLVAFLNSDTNRRATFFLHARGPKGVNFNVLIRSNNHRLGSGDFYPTLTLQTGKGTSENAVAPAVVPGESAASGSDKTEARIMTKGSGADTFLAEHHPNKNWDGGVMDLRSMASPMRHNMPVMRFELPSWVREKKVAEASITFDITRPDEANGSIEVYGLEDGIAGETDWDESVVTYNSMPGLSGADGGVGPDFLPGKVKLLATAAYTAGTSNDFTINSTPELVAFLNADTNGAATIFLHGVGPVGKNFNILIRSNDDALGPGDSYPTLHIKAMSKVEAPGPPKVKPIAFEVTDRKPDFLPAPKVQPWKIVPLNAEYGGMWIVAGDLDKDGEIELVSAKNKYWWTGPHTEGGIDTQYVSSIAAQKLDGSTLWTWGNPEEGRRPLSHDLACQVYDWNGDGLNEVIVTGEKALHVFRGSDGKLLHAFPVPQYATDCVITANLTGGPAPRDFVIKDRYFQMWGMSAEGRILWASPKTSGINDTWHLGHRPIPVDLDHDGRDELFAGFFMISSEGKKLWEIPGCDHKDVIFVHADGTAMVKKGQHPEDWRFAFTWCSGAGIALVDGTGKVIRQTSGFHYEAISSGRIFPDYPAPQLVVDVDHLPYGEAMVDIFDAELNLLGRIKLDYGRFHKLVDWDGDGFQDIVIAEHGAVYNYEGKRIATLDLGGKKGMLLQVGDLPAIKCLTYLLPIPR